MKYERKVKKIKSLISKHDSMDILDVSLRYLYDAGNDKESRLQRHPWLVLLIIKWTFINENRNLIKPLTNDSYMTILNAIYDLAELVKMPTDHNNVHQFMRNMAYQQFIYQHDFSILHIGRNSLLFNYLPENHNLKLLFKKKHGLELRDFISLSFTLIAFVHSGKKHTVEVNDFLPLFKYYSKSLVTAFLDSMSINIKDLSHRLSKDDLSKANYSEYYEQSPFIKYPLIKHGLKYTCVDPFILYRCIENFLYDTLKADEPQKFMKSFGKIFEKYLLKGLRYANLDFIEESNLKKHLPPKIKCIDYVIEQKTFNIFIDAKGVEMPYLGKVTDNPKIILDRVKSSAIKAIEQASAFNNYIFLNDNENLPEFKMDSCLLVVTYKELYLGNGQLLYETVAKDKIDSINEFINEKARIDLKRIYFITVDNFDFMMSLVKNHELDIGDILEKAIADDGEGLSKKFEFSQHIHSFVDQIAPPKFLKEETDKILSEFKSNISEA
jgi:hypothetical protein